MTRLRLLRPVVRLIGVGVLTATCLSASSSAVGAAAPRAASAVPTCAYSQLEVAVAWGPGDAGGHYGIPFIIANISPTACSLLGYPALSVNPSTYKSHSLKVIDGGGGVFVAAAPRRVVLLPGRDASFGLNIGEGANQGDPNGAACTAKYVDVGLTLRPGISLTQNYETIVDFNYCHSGFEVYVTAIEPGPLPKIA